MKKITLSLPSSSKKKQQAFSLIELLITVTIMAVLLSVGIVNYFRYLERQRFYLFAGQVESIINDARVRARTGFLGDDEHGFCNQVETVELEMTRDTNSFLVLTERLNCVDGTVVPLDVQTSEEVYTVDALFSIAFSPTESVIMKRGAIETNNMTITLSNSNGQVVYDFAQGGLLTVEYD